MIKWPPCPDQNKLLGPLTLNPSVSSRLTDPNDCIIQRTRTTPAHPPLPCPLLTAPVSHEALAQSTEIVPCLFLNTHLYLTAY